MIGKALSLLWSPLPLRGVLLSGVLMEHVKGKMQKVKGENGGCEKL
jgi:hypothetical protein